MTWWIWLLFIFGGITALTLFAAFVFQVLVAITGVPEDPNDYLEDLDDR